MKEQFDNYIKLYQAGTPVKDINPIDNQTYRVLVGSGIDIRVIDRDKHLSEIYNLDSLRHFSKDTKDISGRFFYAIPIQTVKGTIVGFIFRSVFGKNYTTVNRTFSDKEKKLPLMFGFYKDFLSFDRYSECPPIVVCEGLKDCITLKKVYPFVLANNTSSMGINLRVLNNLTDKFILVYDNDEAGIEGSKRDSSNIYSLIEDAVTITPKTCYKDCADCYDESKQDFKEFADKLKETIRLLMSKNNQTLGRKIISR